MTLARSSSARKASVSISSSSSRKRKTSITKTATELERAAVRNNLVFLPSDPISMFPQASQQTIFCSSSSGEESAISYMTCDQELSFAFPATSQQNLMVSPVQDRPPVSTLATPIGAQFDMPLLPEEPIEDPQEPVTNNNNNNNQEQPPRQSKMHFIKDTVKRNRTYYKRKEFVFLKVQEISAMTGAEVLLIISNPVTGTVTPFASPMFEPLLHTPYGMTLVSQCMTGADWKAAMIKQQDKNPISTSNGGGTQVPDEISQNVAYNNNHVSPTSGNMASIHNILNHDDGDENNYADAQNVTNNQNDDESQNAMLQQLLMTLP